MITDEQGGVGEGHLQGGTVAEDWLLGPYSLTLHQDGVMMKALLVMFLFYFLMNTFNTAGARSLPRSLSRALALSLSPSLLLSLARSYMILLSFTLFTPELSRKCQKSRSSKCQKLKPNKHQKSPKIKVKQHVPEVKIKQLASEVKVIR